MAGVVSFHVLLKDEIRSAWIVPGAALSFAGAILAGLGGCVLTTSWLPGGSGHPWLYQLGTVLLIVTIPLLICGGHCLDLLERAAKKERVAMTKVDKAT